jgi:hypothetical protein
MIDSLLHSSGLSRVIPLTVKRKKSIGIFDVEDELGEGGAPEKTAFEPIQTPHKIQGLSLLNLSNIKNSPTHEIISHGDDMLDQLKTLQYQLLEGEVSYELLKKLERVLNGFSNTLTSIPAGLHDVIDDIQVRVAVELTKLSINRL